LNWLQSQPLLIHDHGYILPHAGKPPKWSIKKAAQLAAEAEDVLQSDSSQEFFDQLYNKESNLWNKKLSSPDRWHVITNYLTQMRYCDDKGLLEFDCKKHPSKTPEHLTPWFNFPKRAAKKDSIIFGH
jgi:bis(5'-nucleosyl)-tetraphosphatase (symmetrical)